MSTSWSVSAIVPTRNEAGNMAELVGRMPACVRELIIVDDSDDETARTAQALRPPFEMLVIHRPKGQRAGGLSGAVLRGVVEASSEWVCVLDGDLQHPPELIEQLVRRAEAGDTDIVVACRHGDEAWAAMSPFRRGLSSLAGRAALAGLSSPATDRRPDERVLHGPPVADRCRAAEGRRLQDPARGVDHPPRAPGRRGSVRVLSPPPRREQGQRTRGPPLWASSARPVRAGRARPVGCAARGHRCGATPEVRQSVRGD